MTTAGRKYFVTADEKRLGPFTGQQIRTKLFRKTITLDDYVWYDGLGEQWVPLKTILNEIPSDAAPPPAPEVLQLTEIKVNHPNGLPDTLIKVPEKGVYEPPATLKQKNFLMKLGLNPPEAIRRLGRDQASYIIDQLKADYSAMKQRESQKTLGILGIVILCVIVIAVIVYGLAK